MIIFKIDDGTYFFEFQQWKPTASVLWSVKGLDRPVSLDAFLKEPIFDGKTFWECEKEIEWDEEYSPEYKRDVLVIK